MCELNNEHDILSLSIFDTNSQVSTYWWDKFLELDVITNNDENTRRAFDAIEKEILNPLNRKHKQDYFHLWNLTVGYFRCEGEFNLNDYKDNIIGTYVPFDNELNINDLKLKIENLPGKYKFDSRFDKTPSEIKLRFKKEIKLTDEIKLILEHNVATPKITFKKHSDADGKYIMIKSDVGYAYAEGLESRNNN